MPFTAFVVLMYMAIRKANALNVQPKTNQRPRVPGSNSQKKREKRREGPMLID